MLDDIKRRLEIGNMENKNEERFNDVMFNLNVERVQDRARQNDEQFRLLNEDVALTNLKRISHRISNFIESGTHRSDKVYTHNIEEDNIRSPRQPDYQIVADIIKEQLEKAGWNVDIEREAINGQPRKTPRILFCIDNEPKDHQDDDDEIRRRFC